MLESIIEEQYHKPLHSCTNHEIYVALLEYVKSRGVKKLYYVSAEFLMGKMLRNQLLCMGIYAEIEHDLMLTGKSLDEIERYEPEPSLGNGGLGRLAACFLDSMATLGLNGDGIGLNYHYGLFRQRFFDHRQVEETDPWMEKNNWLISRHQKYTVSFGTFDVEGILYDMPIIGYDNRTNWLHLFDCKTVDESMVKDGIVFDKTQVANNLTLFLYPDDSDEEGKLLRLYQEYFLSSCGVQYILEEAKQRGSNLYDLPEYVFIQINDTHPSLMIPEMIRLLRKEGIEANRSRELVEKIFAYTNHTILSEALEKWHVDQLEEVVPALLPILRELNRERPEPKIIDEEEQVHMANMDIHYGVSVNGVAALHTGILKKSELKSFYKLYPHKFNNKTNGITFRRWLLLANPELSRFLDRYIGTGYRKDAMELKKLRQYESNDNVLHELLAIKHAKKEELATYLMDTQDIRIDSDHIFDIQIKRMHEYKRQQLNLLYIIHTYIKIVRGEYPKHPITVLFGAKAAPAYQTAKDIIHVILCMSELIRKNRKVSTYMNVVMVENYNVTLAEKLIPACDISEQISLASKEASGTGNMKMMLNGAVTLGTMDGANVEIAELVGDYTRNSKKRNCYIFGKSSEEVIRAYEEKGYCAREYYENDKEIRECVDFITGQEMNRIGNSQILQRVQRELIEKDWFMTLLDYDEYVKTKDDMIEDYGNRIEWARKMLINISEAGYFSADRTILEYNEDIWRL